MTAIGVPILMIVVTFSVLTNCGKVSVLMIVVDFSVLTNCAKVSVLMTVIWLSNSVLTFLF